MPRASCKCVQMTPYRRCEAVHMDMFRKDPEPTVNGDLRLQVAQERVRRLAFHLLHAHAALQVVNEALEEGEEMLRPPDVARHLYRHNDM